MMFSSIFINFLFVKKSYLRIGIKILLEIGNM